jgi:hypothetical protein
MPTFVITPVGDTYSMVSDEYHNSLLEKGAVDSVPFVAATLWLFNVKSFCVVEDDGVRGRCWHGTYDAEYSIDNTDKFEYGYTNLSATYNDYNYESVSRIEQKPLGSAGTAFQSGIINPLKYKLNSSEPHSRDAPPYLTGEYLGDFYYYRGQWYISYSDFAYKYAQKNRTQLKNLDNAEVFQSSNGSIISKNSLSLVLKDGVYEEYVYKRVVIKELFYGDVDDYTLDLFSERCATCDRCLTSGPVNTNAPNTFEVTEEEFESLLATPKTEAGEFSIKLVFSAEEGTTVYCQNGSTQVTWDKETEYDITFTYPNINVNGFACGTQYDGIVINHPIYNRQINKSVDNNKCPTSGVGSQSWTTYGDFSALFFVNAFKYQNSYYINCSFYFRRSFTGGGYIFLSSTQDDTFSIPVGSITFNGNPVNIYRRQIDEFKSINIAGEFIRIGVD